MLNRSVGKKKGVCQQPEQQGGGNKGNEKVIFNSGYENLIFHKVMQNVQQQRLRCQNEQAVLIFHLSNF